jgi:nucleoside-diphosphate-sugar epimerase
MSACAETHTVIVLGGTGQIGLFALPRLLDAGYQVISIFRDGRQPASPDEHPNLQWISMGQLMSEITRIKPDHLYLVSAGPIDLALQALEHVSVIQQAVVISTSSVLVKKDSSDNEERTVMARILQTEQEIEAHCAGSGTSLSLLRPTLIYGCGIDENISLVYRWARRWPVFPIAGQAGGLRQPLHADDLAALVVAILDAGLEMNSPVCGGSTITYQEMARRVLSASGTSCRLLRLPPWLFALIARLLSMLPGPIRISPAMIWRQSRDLEFDDRELRRVTGINAQKFRPREQDFKVPVSRLPSVSSNSG